MRPIRYALALLALLLAPAALHAQCTPDAQYTSWSPGLYPQTMAQATANTAYSETLTVVMREAIVDTAIECPSLGESAEVTAEFTSYTFTQASGLPTGLDPLLNHCGNGTCAYTPDGDTTTVDRACFLATGTPTGTNQVYTVEVEAQVQGRVTAIKTSGNNIIAGFGGPFAFDNIPTVINALCPDVGTILGQFTTFNYTTQLPMGVTVSRTPNAHEALQWHLGPNPAAAGAASLTLHATRALDATLTAWDLQGRRLGQTTLQANTGASAWRLADLLPALEAATGLVHITLEVEGQALPAQALWLR